MMRRKAVIAISVFLMFLAAATEGRAEFNVSITDNNNYLDFGAVKCGEEARIALKGGYHHAIQCVSTNGNTWYLKIDVIRPFTCGDKTIPMDNMAVVVEQQVSGQGIVMYGTNRDIPLTGRETTIYTSALGDNTGQQVVLNIYYTLKIPENQVAGSYTANLQYVMIERL
ncbi:MAG: hypothetical protein PHS37_06695 [Candidatus Omnitrophica bacterium]|nr:hypothetical protein [Candidatus Omnitrophota bacterium]